YSGLFLSPGRIRLTYVLDMAEIPTFQETPNIDTNGDGSITAGERQAWADRTVPRVLSGLSLSAGGSRVALSVASDCLSFRPGQGSGVGSAPEAIGGTVRGSPVSSGRSFAALVGWRLTPLVLAVSLLLAFAFGALHALGPGHGKTITAAYLVGHEARVRPAVVAGVAVSFMHTFSVLALGLVALAL